VLGFLGGIMFAALVLVLQSQNQFRVGFAYSFFGLFTFTVAPESYLRFLTLVLALTSIFSIVGSLAMAEVAATKGARNRRMELFSLFCLLAGLSGFGIALPLLLMPAFAPDSMNVPFVLMVVEGALLVVLGTFSRPKKERHKEHPANSAEQITNAKSNSITIPSSGESRTIVSSEPPSRGIATPATKETGQNQG
jgi:uncharacterized integral membrane protein